LSFFVSNKNTEQLDLLHSYHIIIMLLTHTYNILQPKTFVEIPECAFVRVQGNCLELSKNDEDGGFCNG
jgi:hypothetical protein